MTTAQRIILVISLALLGAMFVLIPVDYSTGYDFRWNVGNHVDYRRETDNLVFWVLATVIALFLTIPKARTR